MQHKITNKCAFTAQQTKKINKWQLNTTKSLVTINTQRAAYSELIGGVA